jgi:isoleucyl-tRNA synthetase
MDDDKRAAYETLYESLVTLARTMAPFTPYLAEAMYRNLVVKGGAQRDVPESVHLTSFPEADTSVIDEGLSDSVRAVRELVSLGLQVRTQAKLKVRQPLSVAKVVLADPAFADRLAPYVDMMKDELNVLAVELVTQGADEYVSFRVKPNFRTLGQKGMGKQAQELKKSMATMNAVDAQALVAKVLADGKATIFGFDIEREDLEVAFDAKEGYAAAGERIGVVVLDTRLDDALRDLGFLREILNRVQTARKELSLDFTDRIHVRLAGSDRAARIVKAHESDIRGECLAVAVEIGEGTAAAGEKRDVDIDGEKVSLWIRKA